jgi:hypothetical protein
MPELRDFLARFRPAGAPGTAARAAVPADRSRELEAEVEPVLALLEDTDAERKRIIEQFPVGVICSPRRANARAVSTSSLKATTSTLNAGSVSWPRVAGCRSGTVRTGGIARRRGMFPARPLGHVHIEVSPGLPGSVT